MSGGYFNYQDSTTKNEIFNWSSRCWNAFEDREISELVWDMFDLIHDFDWYKSGDTGEERYLKSKEAFKKKWIGRPTARVKRIVDETIEDARRELYKTYGIKETQDESEV